VSDGNVPVAHTDRHTDSYSDRHTDSSYSDRHTDPYAHQHLFVYTDPDAKPNRWGPGNEHFVD
jgi:hypothetical protein